MSTLVQDRPAKAKKEKKVKKSANFYLFPASIPLTEAERDALLNAPEMAEVAEESALLRAIDTSQRNRAGIQAALAFGGLIGFSTTWIMSGDINFTWHLPWAAWFAYDQVKTSGEITKSQPLKAKVKDAHNRAARRIIKNTP